MQLKDIQSLFHKDLDEIYGKEEVESFFFLCIETYYNISRLTLALDQTLSITKHEQDLIFKALDQLKQQKPIQYILGETEFYGLTFKVNDNVLIPRPETEELVDWIVSCHSEWHEESRPINILDIGTGSGCIAISLAKHIPNAKVFAVDVSEDALDIAKENARLNGVTIEFIETSILDEASWNLMFKALEFDIIVSNPPYVCLSEKALMKPNVLENEPHLALFVEDNDPLIFYRTISKFAKDYLKKNKPLFFEINEGLGEPMKELLENSGFNAIELRKDMFGKDRMVKGIKN